MKDADIDKVFEGMPGGVNGFLKEFGYRQFARAILEREAEIRADATKPLPFDLEAAKAGAPLVTRDGRNVRFVAHVPEAEPDWKVLAFIDGEYGADSFSEAGLAHTGREDSLDLLMAPKPKRTVWVNFSDHKLHGTHGCSASHHVTAADAKAEAAHYQNLFGKPYIAIAVPIEIDA